MKSKLIFLLLGILIPAYMLHSQPKKYEAVKEESVIKYKLTHPLHEVVGVSKSAICLIYADAKTKDIKNVLVEVPVTSFNTGNSNRDSHAMEVVNAISYPTAKFLSTSVQQKGDSIKVYGKLTFHGITKDIVINAATSWSSNKLIVNGGFDISLTEFHIERPSLLLIPVNDNLQFFLTQVFNL